MFCVEVVKQNTYSDAYRIAYDCSNSTPKTVNERASTLMADSKIVARVEEIKKKVEQKELYTIGESVKRDKALIERYEGALDTLENIDSSTKEVEVAERLIRHIGSSAYNSAQERLSKQHGFFEKDNDQKAISIDIPPIKWATPQ